MWIWWNGSKRWVTVCGTIFMITERLSLWNESILVLFTRYWTTFQSCVQVIALCTNDVTISGPCTNIEPTWSTGIRVLYGEVTFANNFSLPLKIFIVKRSKIQLGFNNIYLRWQNLFQVILQSAIPQWVHSTFQWQMKFLFWLTQHFFFSLLFLQFDLLFFHGMHFFLGSALWLASCSSVLSPLLHP